MKKTLFSLFALLIVLISAECAYAQTEVYSKGNVKILQLSDGWQVLHGMEVVAYGDGIIDVNDMPPMFQDFLEYYAEKQVTNKRKSLKKSGSNGIIWGPYIKTTRWNQNPSPFWDAFPIATGYDTENKYVYDRNVYTGCTTISTAQVLNYYKYCNPFSVNGTNTTSRVDRISSPYFTNIDETQRPISYEYDYSYNPNFDVINSNDSELSQFLMGIALAQKAEFGLNGTLAPVTNQKTAFENLFGYECAYYWESGSINSLSYNSIIINALQNGCPVIVSGTTPKDNGHSFVVDGYDENKAMYHITFGWGGNYDNSYMSLNDDYLRDNNRNYFQRNTFLIAHPADKYSVFMQKEPQYLHIVNLDNDYKESIEMVRVEDLTYTQYKDIKLLPGKYEFYFEYFDGSIIAPYVKTSIPLSTQNLHFVNYGRYVSTPAKINILEGLKLTFWHTANQSEVKIDCERFDDGCLVITPPKKIDYLQGERFDDTGLEVFIGYYDGTKTKLSNGDYSLSGFDSNSLGEKNVTISYNGETKSFKVNILERVVESISIETNKSVYKIGEKIAENDLKVTAKYSDGSKREVFDYAISGFDTYTIGTKNVTISYKKLFANYDINVVEESCDKVYISGQVLDTDLQPLKNASLTTGDELPKIMQEKEDGGLPCWVREQYTQDDYVSFIPTQNFLTKIEIKVWYKNNPGNLSVSIFDMNKQSIWEKTLSQDKVVDNDWTEIDIDNSIEVNVGEQYYIGLKAERCNFDDIYYAFYKTMHYRLWASDNRVIKTDENGYYRFPVEKKWSGTLYAVDNIYKKRSFNILTFNNVIKSVSDKTFVENKSDNETFDYSVASITVTQPDKTEYFIDESFDDKGLKVTAYYNDGTSGQVCGYNISGFDSRTEGVKIVTISYEGKSKDFLITVKNNKRKVQYYLDGEFYKEEECVVGSKITLIDAPQMTKRGYKFMGWIPEIPETMPAEDLICEAQWEIINYDIEYKLDGGVNSTYNPSSYTVECEKITLSDPSKIGYKFNGWQEGNIIEKGSIGNKTFTALWKPLEYTITFIVDGKRFERTFTYGTTNPSLEEDKLKKESTAEWTYNFANWSPEIKEVTEAATYTAQFTSTVNEYEIIFVNEDGTELQKSRIAYGKKPKYIGEEPTKAATEQYKYTFNGWSPEIKEVTEAATYTTQFTPTINEYEIIFVNEDGSEFQKSKITYGETPIYSGETPTKAATAQYTYTFNGWFPEIKEVTEAATYTAQFSETKRKYTIIFDDNGHETPKEFEYNSKITDDDKPTKANSIFDGWYKDVNLEYKWNLEEDVITKDMTLYAKWQSDPTTSVSETDNKPLTFKVFPNPATDIVKIAGNSFVTKKYLVCTLNGSIVKSGYIINELTEIDVSNLASGVYIIRIDNQTEKFIKE